MEYVVKLQFELQGQEQAFDDIVAVFQYLRDNTIILFEEQFDDMAVELSHEQRARVMEFIQNHADFFGASEEFEVDDSSFYAVFVGGNDSEVAIKRLKKLFALFELKNYKINSKVY